VLEVSTIEIIHFEVLPGLKEVVNKFPNCPSGQESMIILGARGAGGHTTYFCTR
jgi:hypothetical protein